MAERAITAMGSGLRLRGPDQQTADGMTLVEGIEQPAHLVAIQHVTPLELGQGHMAAVDVVEDGGSLHVRRILPVRSCCIIPCFVEQAFFIRSRSRPISLLISIKTSAMAFCSATVGNRTSALEMCDLFVA